MAATAKVPAVPAAGYPIPKCAPDAFATFPERLRSTADKPEEKDPEPTPALVMPEVVWSGKATKLKLPEKLKGLHNARGIHVVGNDIVVADAGKSRVLLLNDEAETKGRVLLEGCGKLEGTDLLQGMDAIPYGSGLLVMDTGRARVCWLPERNDATQAASAQPAVIFQPGGSHRPYAKLEGLKFPRSIVTTPKGLWICDAWSHRLVRVPLTPELLAAPAAEVQQSLDKGAVTAVGGTEKVGTTLRFPHSLVVLPSDDEREVVLVSDANNHRVLRVTWRVTGGDDDSPEVDEDISGAGELESVEPVLGTGEPGGAEGQLSAPCGLAYDAETTAVYIADKDNARVLELLDGKTRAVYGSPQPVGLALRRRGGKRELLVTDLLSDDIAVVEL